MEAVVELGSRVGHAFAIGWVMLSVTICIGQVLTTDFIKVINVNIDVVIAVAIIAAVIVVVMMMIPVIIVIPVNIAEYGVSCRHTETKPQAFHQAIGKLLAWRWW